MHRNPVDVFRSAAHMADTTYWYTYLNTPSSAMIQEYILATYEELWNTYEAARTRVPAGQLLEVAFDDLVSNPMETTRRIYDYFQWDGRWRPKEEEEEGGGNVVPMRLRKETKSLAGYVPNAHAPLPASLSGLIEERWGTSFDRLGYARPSSRQNETENCDE
mmetsp:Transcript_61916/g.85125  ORF Transcript_61916/g.85125 Transcript_61916/m.85125 type:complete len:162 (-) Transcript_61916:248-733(-)